MILKIEILLIILLYKKHFLLWKKRQLINKININ